MRIGRLIIISTCFLVSGCEFIAGDAEFHKKRVEAVIDKCNNGLLEIRDLLVKEAMPNLDRNVSSFDLEAIEKVRIEIKNKNNELEQCMFDFDGASFSAERLGYGKPYYEEIEVLYRGISSDLFSTEIMIKSFDKSKIGEAKANIALESFRDIINKIEGLEPNKSLKDRDAIKRAP